MNNYGPKAQTQIHDVIKKYEKGNLKSGKSADIVKSRKQAIAIGISEAHDKGYKVPKSS